ncbi:hypothetical protein ACOACQ_03385 [Nocardioides sp. CPCC 206347]|uniref:hypothetical protein n=1 Tax=unclassified Nocardioides TaxID=2615069 RepID=UPI0036162D4B
MSSARDFEAPDGELGRWIDARTIELLEDLEEHWGGRFDEARARELVTAYLGLRGSTEALSEEDRFSLLNGAAMALLGDEYRPPSPTSEFSAPVDLNAGFNALASLSIAARDWHRHHAEVPDAEGLQTTLVQLHAWIDALADTCFELAEQLERLIVSEQGEFDDSVLVTAQVATTSADLLDSVADRAEREYLDTDDSKDQWAAIAACASLRTSVDDLRQATGAP